MKAGEFLAAIKTQRPDRKYLYYDEEYRVMIEITRSICNAEIYYDIVCGPFESFGVNNWVASNITDDFVFAGYYHEYANGHITNEDFFELKVKNLIPKGMQVEMGDVLNHGGEEVEFTFSKRGAGREEYEKSEKDAMWERD